MNNQAWLISFLWPSFTLCEMDGRLHVLHWVISKACACLEAIHFISRELSGGCGVTILVCYWYITDYHKLGVEKQQVYYLSLNRSWIQAVFGGLLLYKFIVSCLREILNLIQSFCSLCAFPSLSLGVGLALWMCQWRLATLWSLALLILTTCGFL